MKKSKIALAVGLCLTIGLCGTGVAACGGNEPTEPVVPVATNEKSDYYLAGSNASGILSPESNPDGWYSGYKTVEEIPAEICFKKTNVNNVYMLTIDFYERDEFQILTVNQGWNGQMGYEIMAEGQDAEQMLEKPGGGTNSNIKVGQSGKYTFTLTMGDTKSLSFKRDGDAAKLVVKATSVTLSQVKATIKVDDELQLTATVAPDDADDKTVTWKSSDPTKVTVDTTGKIKGIATTSGETVTITATCGTVSETCAVRVLGEGEEIRATAVKITNKPGEDAWMHVGDELTLTATVTPDDSTDDVNWSIVKEEGDESDDLITLDASTGKVTAVMPGFDVATVKATAGAVSDTADIKVMLDYYFRGTSKNPDIKGWDKLTKYSDIGENALFLVNEMELSDTGVSLVYKATGVNLYSGDSFKLMALGFDWDDHWGALSGDCLADSTTTVNVSTQVGKAEGNDPNILIKENGKYDVTLRVSLGETESYSIEFERKGDADAVVWATDIVAHGSFGGAGWANSEVLNTTPASGENKVVVVSLELAIGDEFGFKLYDSGETTGDLWVSQHQNCGSFTLCDGLGGSDNIKCTAAGTYKFTFTFDDDGGVTSIVAAKE